MEGWEGRILKGEVFFFARVWMLQGTKVRWCSVGVERLLFGLRSGLEKQESIGVLGMGMGSWIDGLRHAWPLSSSSLFKFNILPSRFIGFNSPENQRIYPASFPSKSQSYSESPQLHLVPSHLSS